MIYVVIPVFNRIEFTKECIISLEKQTFKDFKVIVVDDGSTDGTQEIIKTKFPEVILLETKGDLFWTATINMGIKYALNNAATYILTLNNDTKATPTFMEMMHLWALKEPNALLGAFAIDFQSRKPIYAGEIFNLNNSSRFYLGVSTEKFEKR